LPQKEKPRRGRKSLLVAKAHSEGQDGELNLEMACKSPVDQKYCSASGAGTEKVTLDDEKSF